MKKPSSQKKKLRLAIVGASGRMGQKILDVLESDDPVSENFQLVWEGSLRKSSEIEALVASKPQLIIDFSKPQGTLAWVRAYEKHAKIEKPAALVCTTGFGTSETNYLHKSLKGWTWALVPNTSLGIFALAESLKPLARTLPEEYVFAIFESHHSKKVDAPSGTALFLKSTIEEASPMMRDIQISAARGGSDPGTHTVFVLGPHEKLEITHRAEDRALFARGALLLGRELASPKQNFRSTRPLSASDLINPSKTPQ
jgi:4-hydroxy-tetrahydrodipicolinate reductase